MPAYLTPPAPGSGFDHLLTLSGTSSEDLRELRRLLARIRSEGGGRTQLWIQGVEDGDDDLAERLGFSPYRDLWQLRRALPAPATDLPVRAFRPDDADAFLEVNRRAFAWHPEQGLLDANGLADDQAMSWYDPAGFLLHERDGRLAGFCWTKIHAEETPPLGEIYAIATDPDFAGKGIGRGLTLAGLEHLHSSGLKIAVLYVESDNHAANALYAKLGFSNHHTNRAYEAVLV